MSRPIYCLQVHLPSTKYKTQYQISEYGDYIGMDIEPGFGIYLDALGLGES
jgi:hypothetical protein